MTTRYIPGHGDVPLRPMDVDVSWGKESLARLMRTVVALRCQVLDSFTLTADPHPGDTVFLRVFIPEPWLERFREMARPVEMRDPPRVQVGIEADPRGNGSDEG